MSKLAKYNNPDPTAAQIDMERYGITKSTVEYFHYKTFRYTTLQEAINQAKREDQSRNSADAL
ncbi:MAG: hypothetical protein ACFE0P_05405 [Oceanicaulis sp.]